MKTIYKYTLRVTDLQHLDIQGTILSVAIQNEQIVMYALVDERAKARPYEIRIHGTGHLITDIDDHTFLGTVSLQGGRLMFHVFCKVLNGMIVDGKDATIKHLENELEIVSAALNSAITEIEGLRGGGNKCAT